MMEIDEGSSVAVGRTCTAGVTRSAQPGWGWVALGFLVGCGAEEPAGDHPSLSAGEVAGALGAGGYGVPAAGGLGTTPEGGSAGVRATEHAGAAGSGGLATPAQGGHAGAATASGHAGNAGRGEHAGTPTVGGRGGGAAQSGQAGLDPSTAQAGAPAYGGSSGQPGSGGNQGGHWVVQELEDFSSTALPTPAWSPDPVPDDGPFSDSGAYFQALGITPPEAFRITQPFGHDGWLTLESYTREGARSLRELATVVSDPAGSTNQVLRIRSVEHTDATVVRPSAALPDRYRISVRVGYASFGDGISENNGYDGGTETAEPWLDDSAVSENGFYWLTILDSMPRPHNNVWIHHHRKVCIDSDNTTDGWMNVWNGASCQTSGAHPVMVFALDGTSAGSETSGKSFLSYRGDAWRSGICAADAYRNSRWYTVSIERFDNRFTLTVAGDFENGGSTTYSGSIDAEQACVWHYNNAALASDHPCVDLGYYSSLGPSYPHWPSGVGYPDYFMFGEPHANYYEGTVYYDDVKLEVWNDGV